MGQRFQKIDTAEFRHLNIEQEQVDRLLLQHRHGFQRVLTFSNQFEKWQAQNVVFQQGAGKFFIVDDQAAYFIHWMKMEHGFNR